MWPDVAMIWANVYDEKRETKAPRASIKYEVAGTALKIRPATAYLARIASEKGRR